MLNCTQFSVFLALSIFFSAHLGYAQKLSGTILDKSTGKEIAFVNVVLPGSKVGSVSDENGVFDLELAQQIGSDSLIFSCLGYHPDTISIELLSQKKNNRIFLQSMHHELPLVEVLPKDYRKKLLGNKIKHDLGIFIFENKTPGYEIGVQMKTRGKPSWIDSVHIRFTECLIDSVFFRMNIYEFSNGVPDNNLLSAPIYINISPGSSNTFRIGLQKLNLKTDRDFLVSLELLRDQSENPFSLSTGFFTAPSYYRLNNQDEWHKFPFGINIAAFVKQEK